MTQTAPLNIGILLGSARTNSNSNGIASWVQTHLHTLLTGTASGTTHLGKTTLLPLTTYPLPLGPLTDDFIPGSVQLIGATNLTDGIREYAYQNQRDKDWSCIVQGLDGLVFVTPQYNWSIPGELKNAIDHIYLEWKGLPIASVTYGFSGGDKAAEALRPIVECIEAVDVSIGKVKVSLTGDLIHGQQRLSGDDEMLVKYEEVLKEELGKVIAAAAVRKAEKSTARPTVE